MSDLIERQAAMSLAGDLQIHSGEYQQYNQAINNYCAELIKLPSAEPEIIYCKDCKYYGRADKKLFYRGADCLNNHIRTIVADRDYCSRAERRID